METDALYAIGDDAELVYRYLRKIMQKDGRDCQEVDRVRGRRLRKSRAVRGAPHDAA